MENFWQSVLHQLEKDLLPQQYNTWVKPLTPVDYANGILQVAAPNQFKRDYAKTQFSNRLATLASQYWQTPVEIKFLIDNKQKKPLPVVGLPVTKSAVSQKETVKAKKKELEEQHNINKEMTFDNFVVGAANQLAVAAATQVTINLGKSYNPLYIYGGVGLGKTHLMHAIANKVLQEKPESKIRCIHAERYIRDVVSAAQKNSFDELKRYYYSLDVLLIDDIQFLTGKKRTQDELFLVFEALTAAQKQVIITSEAYPKEITGLPPRLISRFDSGLTVAIEPPELEMRVAILLKKASLEGVALNDDVAFFVAQHLHSNIREMEGALKKILAYSKFHRKNITIDVTREALKDLLSVQSRQISIENIQKTVADFFNIKITDMTSKQRTANIVYPRQMAMYLSKELTQKSLPEIGKLFGGRDHTTVLYAVKKIAQERKKNQECNRQLHTLEQTLKG